MANDSQRDKARAIFGKTFFENTKEKAPAKNGAVALQQRANARPIPTYKVGGVVKKQEGGRMSGQSAEADDVLITTPRGQRMLEEQRRREREAAAKAKAAAAAKRAKADTLLGIPAHKEGGRANEDFTGLMKKAASRAAAKGDPLMKDGGPTNEYIGKRINARMAAGNYKDGGRAEMRNERKMADIEKDYKIALAKGKNEGVAKAKYEQRKADAADDYAKATKADRSVTRGAEKAAEAALKEARRTKGVSISNRDNAESFMQKNSKSVAPKINVSETLKGLGVMPAAAEKVATPKSRSAPVRKATPVRKAPPVRQAPPAPPAPPVRQAPPTVTPPAPRGGSAPAAVNPRMIAPRSSNLLTDQAAISRAKPQADARREMTEAKNKRVTALGDFLGNIPTPAIFGSGNAAKSYAERQKKMGYTSGPVKRAAGGAAKARKS